jgi:hypothetical protein
MMKRTWISMLFNLMISVAATSCRGGSDGRIAEELTADAGSGSGSGSGSGLIQPTCVDDRLPDHDGVDDGQTCEATDTSTICTIVSQCPNYCVHCSDGTSTCTPCSP